MPRADQRLRSASSPISATVRRRQRREALSGQKSVRHVPGLFCQLSPRPLIEEMRDRLINDLRVRNGSHVPETLELHDFYLWEYAR